MKTVIIAEKPIVAQAIATALIGHYQKHEGYFEGDRYIVTWAYGHLFSLAEPEVYDSKYKKWMMDDLPILPKKFILTSNKENAKHLKIVKKLCDNTNEIINACDSGREGELIHRYLMNGLGINKPVKRLWTSSLTPEAIHKAFSSLQPSSHFDNLYKAAKLRSESDWIVGMNTSRAFSIKFNDKFSLGRVQTPVLAMIVERQESIETFTSQKFFEVEAIFIQGVTSRNGKNRTLSRYSRPIVFLHRPTVFFINGYYLNVAV